MKLFRKMTALVLALSLALTLSACGKGQEDFVLSVTLPGQINTLDPAMVTNETEKTVVSHLYENLMKYTNDGEGGVQLSYGMASGYTVEDNLDGTQTYTFTLRDRTTWSDGKKVTAHDFVTAWRRLADPATASPNAAMLSLVSGYDEARSSGDMTKLQVTAPDERTLVVVLRHSSLQFPQLVCTQAATMPLRADTLADNHIMATYGNGPYGRLELLGDTDLSLSAHEGYYDARRLGSDALLFHTQGAGSADSDFVLTLGSTDALEGWDEDGWNRGSLPHTGTLVFNQMSSLNEDIRQAMSLVIDRQYISELLGTMYIPAQGLIPAGILNTQGTPFRAAAGSLIETDSELYAQQCEEAKALLQGKILPDEDEITLCYTADEVTIQVAVALKKVWKEQLDLDVTLQGLPMEELVEALNKGEFSMALVMLSCEENDPAVMLKKWVSGAQGNYAHIQNSAYDLLLRISDAATTAIGRDAYLVDAERMLLQSGLVAPICYLTDSWQLQDTLTGVYGDGMGQYYFGSVVKKAK